MLAAYSVCHRYDNKTVLQAPDIVLRGNEHCVLIGASGSGKTTLLHVLAGLLRPQSGEVSLDGHTLYPPRLRSDRWRASRIGVVPQRLHLLPSLDALDNVRLSQYLAGRSIDSSAMNLLDTLGLRDRLRARPDQLSTGEQQRVAIARAIVNRPRLLLADEPTSALDDDNAARAIDLLFDAARLSSALLVVATHDARIHDRFGRRITLTRPGA